MATAAFLVAIRSAPSPAGSSAKARALAVSAISVALLGATALVLELGPLLGAPPSAAAMRALAGPLLLSGGALALWQVSCQLCVAETSAATACLVSAYAILPAIPLATLALRGAHAAAKAAEAADSFGGVLPAGLARRGLVSTVGVMLMACACGCFAYSKERTRRIEAMLGAAELDGDEPGETAGLVAALTADAEDADDDDEMAGLMGAA
jgi:hypothetical protein